MSRFNWTEYFNFAEALVTNSQLGVTEEARYRSAISRAYYAVYKRAENFLKENEKGICFSPKLTDSHQFVMTTFKGGDLYRRGIGTALDRLRQKRNQADYQDYFSDLKRNCDFSILEAKGALSKLDRLR